MLLGAFGVIYNFEMLSTSYHMPCIKYHIIVVRLLLYIIRHSRTRSFKSMNSNISTVKKIMETGYVRIKATQTRPTKPNPVDSDSASYICIYIMYVPISNDLQLGCLLIF